jgi:hypothetical protein
MKNTFKKVFIGFMAFAMATGSFAQQRAHKKDNESYPKEWKQIARMEQDSFFLIDEARRIAENVLAFQRCTGGWPKNIDMARRMNDKELAKVIKDKSRRDDSTIDNNATTAQMIFLARLYRQTKGHIYILRPTARTALKSQYIFSNPPSFIYQKERILLHTCYLFPFLRIRLIILFMSSLLRKGAGCHGKSHKANKHFFECIFHYSYMF